MQEIRLKSQIYVFAFSSQQRTVIDMALSDFVIKAIHSIECIPSLHYIQAIEVLKSMIHDGADEKDIHVLNLISKILATKYSRNEQSFVRLPLSTNDEDFSLNCVQSEDYTILNEIAELTKANWICAKIYHTLWYATNDHSSGEKAVASYLRLFEETFDPNYWVECNSAIQNAYMIATKLGRKTETFKRVLHAIDDKLVEMNGNDPLFLSLNLLQLTMQDVSKEFLSRYSEIVKNIANKNISITNEKINLADETFAVQETLFKKLGKNAELDIAKQHYANYYKALAEQENQRQNYLRAVELLKKACELYSKCDKSRVLELRIRLANYQEKVSNNMCVIPYKIDTTSIHKLSERVFKGRTIQEGIVQLGRMAKIYHVEDVREALRKSQINAPLSTLFRSVILNDKGQVIEQLPPLGQIENADSDLLYKHMVRYVSESRKNGEGIALRIAFTYFKKLGNVTENDLNFLVDNNVIVPEGRGQIIKEGLAIGLTGNFFTSLHILLPQMEHIIRQLVEVCGDTVTYLKEDGTEEYKSLSQLFKSQKLLECYDGDILFTLYSIMDDPCGENLRNLNAHGLLEPRNGNGVGGIYFICLFIRLLLMYSKEGKTLVVRLSDEDPS